jgi:hypothetical protein
MDFLSIAKTVGAGLFSTLVPGGAGILTAVNAVLPDDKKLPETATGHDIVNAVDKLPPELKAKVQLKKFDVKIEQIKQSHDTLRTMLASEATSKQTTRPQVVLLFTWFFMVIATIYMIGYLMAVLSKNPDMVDAVLGAWPVVLALVSLPAIIIKAYFGILEKEQSNKLNAMNGLPTSQIEGLTNKLGKLIRGK